MWAVLILLLTKMVTEQNLEVIATKFNFVRISANRIIKRNSINNKLHDYGGCSNETCSGIILGKRVEAVKILSWALTQASY
jgi:hypothetical protein